jgi:hypothetical protein
MSERKSYRTFPGIVRLASGVSVRLAFQLPLAVWLMSTPVLAGSLDAIALSGQPAPGMPPSVSFVSGFSAPVINARGDLIFLGRVAGPSISESNDEGLWAYRHGALSLVAREGADIPGQPSGTMFTAFYRNTLHLSDAGRIVWMATAADAARSRLGIWSWENGAFSPVAQQNDPAPGFPGGTLILPNVPGRPTDPVGEALKMNNAGQIAFMAQVSGVPVNPNLSYDYHGIWTDRDGSLELVVGKGGTNTSVQDAVFNEFGGFNLSNSGHVAFGSNVAGPSINYQSDGGLWVESEDGRLLLIARDGDAAIGFGDAARLYGQRLGLWSDSGSTMIWGGIFQYIGGTHGNEARWFGPPTGPFTLVDSTITQFQGQDSELIIEGGGHLFVEDDGKGILKGSLRHGQGGVDDSNDEIIWDERTGKIILREGNHAPGTPEAIRFGRSHSEPAINAAGKVAILGDLIDSYGVFAQDPDGNLQLIVREGEIVEVTPGDHRVVDWFGFGRDDPGSLGPRDVMSELGHVALTLQFADASEGVFISNQVLAVPEPASALLSLLAIALFPRRRSRERRKLE